MFIQFVHRLVTVAFGSLYRTIKYIIGHIKKIQSLKCVVRLQICTLST